MTTKADQNTDPVFDNEQIKSILAEERLRQQIRDELTPKGSAAIQKEAKLWRFFNSPFGLLLASSVVVAGLGRAYVDLHNELMSRGEARGEALKLAGEFDYRLTKALAFTNKIKSTSTTPEDRKYNAIFLWRFVTGDQEFQPSLPEYKNVHWYGIVYRLKLLGFAELSGPATEAILAMDSDLGDSVLDIDEHDKRMDVLFRYRNALASYFD